MLCIDVVGQHCSDGCLVALTKPETKHMTYSGVGNGRESGREGENVDAILRVSVESDFSLSLSLFIYLPFSFCFTRILHVHTHAHTHSHTHT